MASTARLVLTDSAVSMASMARRAPRALTNQLSFRDKTVSMVLITATTALDTSMDQPTSTASVVFTKPTVSRIPMA